MSYNPLSPYWTSLTIGFETGLGLVAYLGAVYIVPFLKRRSRLIDFGERRDIDSLLGDDRWSKFGKFFFKKILRIPTVRHLPVNPIWFCIYFGGFGLAFLTLFIVNGDLLTSVGLVNPFTINGFWYDLLFARSNGQPNGAHIVSYLSVLILAWIVAIKYRDGPIPELFLGGLTGALLFAIHEGLYTAFYYFWYWQYLDWDLTTNVLKDISSFSMVVLFFFAFKKYPFQKIDLSIFKRPALLFTT